MTAPDVDTAIAIKDARISPRLARAAAGGMRGLSVTLEEGCRTPVLDLDTRILRPEKQDTFDLSR